MTKLFWRLLGWYVCAAIVLAWAVMLVVFAVPALLQAHRVPPQAPR